MGNIYRPLSILLIISKVLEKVLLNHFSDFEQEHSILTPSQFGFRKGLSTELALLAQKELILKAIEEKKLASGLFIDFTNAFDYINQELLARKLELYGFRGQATNLIVSDLNHRRQKVNIDNSFPDILPVSCGVPQGSILDPFLFNLYIDYIVSVSSRAKSILYADDASLFLTEKLVNELTRQILHYKD